MKVGVPTEIKTDEYRVALTPSGVRELVERGHEVVVQAGAGEGSAIADADYEAQGAITLPDADAVFGEADMIVKVKEPQAEEVARLEPRHTLFTYLHLAPDPELTQGLIDSGATCVAYETVEDARGRLPLLAPMSEVAGKIATQAGAFMLEKPLGGRGILLGGVPGVAAAKVMVIGGGVVGMNAAFIAIGMEAEVYVYDRNIDRLRELDLYFAGRASTCYASTLEIEQRLPDMDLVIGAVLVHGAKAPYVIRREQLGLMKKGAVIVDVSIDQGGCFETSRPTTHSDPTFEVDGVTHYCVANMPGAVPVTSTYALTNATLPYVLHLADAGRRARGAREPRARAGRQRRRRQGHLPPGGRGDRAALHGAVRRARRGRRGLDERRAESYIPGHSWVGEPGRSPGLTRNGRGAREGARARMPAREVPIQRSLANWGRPARRRRLAGVVLLVRERRTTMQDRSIKLRGVALALAAAAAAIAAAHPAAAPAATEAEAREAAARGAQWLRTRQAADGSGLGGFALTALAAGGLHPADVRVGDGPSAAAWQLDSWATAGPGARATDVARSVLAAHASGIDPARVTPQLNLVARMASYWDGTKLLDPGAATSLSDDVFGLLALGAAGAPQSLLDGVAARIRGQQTAAGGWNFSDGATVPNLDMTGAALAALCTAGRRSPDPEVDEGLAYVRGLQDPATGGFGGNSDTAGWVVSGLRACHEDPIGAAWRPAEKDALDFLLSQQLAERRLQVAGRPTRRRTRSRRSTRSGRWAARPSRPTRRRARAGSRGCCRCPTSRPARSCR